jgi:hypothetical protein
VTGQEVQLPRWISTSGWAGLAFQMCGVVLLATFEEGPLLGMNMLGNAIVVGVMFMSVPFGLLLLVWIRRPRPDGERVARSAWVLAVLYWVQAVALIALLAWIILGSFWLIVGPR